MSGAALAGFAVAAALVLLLALPPLLSAPEDVPRTTAGMFTVSYSCAVIVPILSGLAWDMLHIPALAFLPIFLCGFLMIGFAVTFDFRGKEGVVSAGVSHSRLRGPQIAKLRRDHLLVGHIAFEDADVAGELIHAGDEVRAKSSHRNRADRGGSGR